MPATSDPSAFDLLDPGEQEQDSFVAPPPEPAHQTSSEPSQSSTYQSNSRPMTPPALTFDQFSGAIIGPSNSGKTLLLASLERACDLPVADGMELDFVAKDATAKLISDIIEQLRHGHSPTKPSLEAKEFPFSINVSAEVSSRFLRRPLEKNLKLTIVDGGGEYLFPSDASFANQPDYHNIRGDLLNSIARAGNIILCVNVTQPGLVSLEKNLRNIFAATVTQADYLAHRAWPDRLQEVWHRARRRPAAATRVRQGEFLPAHRFLLLLTKIDNCCRNAATDFLGSHRQYARLMDPIHHARQLLGDVLLRRIFSVLHPQQTTFAVGAVSAMGFMPENRIYRGTPFAEADGTPIKLGVDTGGDILRRWEPFGVRDAIYFLATGKCRGMVRQLTREELKVRREPLEFHYHTHHV